MGYFCYLVEFFRVVLVEFFFGLVGVYFFGLIWGGIEYGGV